LINLGWYAAAVPPHTIPVDKMVIRYFAFLRDITRKSEQLWNDPAERLGDLLAALSKKYGTGFRCWVLEEDGQLSHHSIVLVNGRDARDLNGLDTVLHPGDIIAIFPPVAGG